MQNLSQENGYAFNGKGFINPMKPSHGSLHRAGIQNICFERKNPFFFKNISHI